MKNHHPITKLFLGLALVMLWSTTAARPSLRPVNKTPIYKGLPPKTTYYQPSYKGYRLDWCYTWAMDCGDKPADAYCRYRGYHRAYALSKDDNIGSTKLIGTGQRCTHPNCDGFATITCADPR